MREVIDGAVACLHKAAYQGTKLNESRPHAAVAMHEKNPHSRHNTPTDHAISPLAFVLRKPVFGRLVDSPTWSLTSGYLQRGNNKI